MEDIYYQTARSENLPDKREKQLLASTPNFVDALQHPSAHAASHSAKSGISTPKFTKTTTYPTHDGSEQASYEFKTNTYDDSDDLAETRSTLSCADGVPGGINKRSKLFRSHSCDDLNLRTPSVLQKVHLGEIFLNRVLEEARPTTSDRVYDLGKAIFESPALMYNPARDHVSVQSSSSRGSRTVVSAAQSIDTKSFGDDSDWDGSTLASIQSADDDLADSTPHQSGLQLIEAIDPSPLNEPLDLELIRLSEEKSETEEITCVFCGTVFDGPCHRQKCFDHILATHDTLPASTTSVRECITSERASKLSSQVEVERFFSDSSETIQGPIVASTRSSSQIPQVDLRLLGIGDWCLEDDWIRREAAKPIIAAVVLTEDTFLPQQPDPRALLDTIVKLSDGDGSDVVAERINDLFNGLDLVVEEMSRRFPGDEVVRCISFALNALAQCSVPSLSPCSANHAIWRSAEQSGVTCAISHDRNATFPYGSTQDSALGKQTGESSTGGHSGLSKHPHSEKHKDASPTISIQDIKKRSGDRKLACPFRKHDEVHGRLPSCNHEGWSSMSGVKRHLETKAHNQGMGFIQLCRTCAHYIIDQTEWQTVHLTRLCVRQLGGSTKQIRGAGAVKQWQMLYIKYFPHSQRIPHAYTYNKSWELKAIWMQRQDAIYNVMSNHFGLDFNEPRTTQPSLQMSLSDTAGYATALSIPIYGQTRNNSLGSILEAAESGEQARTVGVPSQDAIWAYSDEPHIAAYENFTATDNIPYCPDLQTYEDPSFSAASPWDMGHDFTSVDTHEAPYQLPQASTPPWQTAVGSTAASMRHPEPLSNPDHLNLVATLSLFTDCLQNSALTATNWVPQAQRISQAYGMNTEERELLFTDLSETIRRRVEQNRVQAAVGA